jgi:hypothetical protein
MNSSYQAVETLLFRARKSVAAGLRKPEPASVPVRARAVAPLPLLIPLKDGLAALKSSFSASVAPIKVSLGIALGAAAPLVAYGVLERGIDSSSQSKSAAAPTVQLETPLTYSVPPAVDKAVTKKPAIASPEKQAMPPEQEPEPKPEPESSHLSGDTQGSEAAGGSSAGHTVHPGEGPDTGSPPPEPTTDPPPVEEEEPPPSDTVTICHHTGSAKNPTVTITVDTHAVETHLGHGDALGACAD